MQDLWLPTDSGILAERKAFNSVFGATYVVRIILAANANTEMNVIDETFFDDLYRFHQRVAFNVEVVVNSSHYNFLSVCQNVTLGSKPGCFQFNPLAYW